MLKKRFMTVLAFMLGIIMLICNSVMAIEVPEKNINLEIENLTRGSIVYALIPEDLLRFNMEKFVDNNINNTYEVERLKAEKIQDFYNKKDYEGYVKYFLELGFTCGANELELRHYCFCFGASEEYEFCEEDGGNYLKVKLQLTDNDKFKIILKDYFMRYNIEGIKFLIDEYGTKTYFGLENTNGVINEDVPHITEYNLTYEYVSNEDFEAIERTIDLTYLIIYIILFFVLLFIVNYAIRSWKDKKEEKEMRKFWKKEVIEKKEQLKAESTMSKKEKKEYRKELKRKEKEEKKEKAKQFREAKRLAKLTRKKKK